eukprot:Ihof_evm6s162 gene=Ihof_evmTU6s162
MASKDTMNITQGNARQRSNQYGCQFGCLGRQYSNQHSRRQHYRRHHKEQLAALPKSRRYSRNIPLEDVRPSLLPIAVAGENEVVEGGSMKFEGVHKEGLAAEQDVKDFVYFIAQVRETEQTKDTHHRKSIEHSADSIEGSQEGEKDPADTSPTSSPQHDNHSQEALEQTQPLPSARQSVEHHVNVNTQGTQTPPPLPLSQQQQQHKQQPPSKKHKGGENVPAQIQMTPISSNNNNTKDIVSETTQDETCPHTSPKAQSQGDATTTTTTTKQSNIHTVHTTNGTDYTHTTATAIHEDSQGNDTNKNIPAPIATTTVTPAPTATATTTRDRNHHGHSRSSTSGNTGSNSNSNSNSNRTMAPTYVPKETALSAVIAHCVLGSMSGSEIEEYVRVNHSALYDPHSIARLVQLHILIAQNINRGAQFVSAGGSETSVGGGRGRGGGGYTSAQAHGLSHPNVDPNL